MELNYIKITFHNWKSLIDPTMKRLFPGLPRAKQKNALMMNNYFNLIFLHVMSLNREPHVACVYFLTSEDYKDHRSKVWRGGGGWPFWTTTTTTTPHSDRCRQVALLGYKRKKNKILACPQQATRSKMPQQNVNVSNALSRLNDSFLSDFRLRRIANSSKASSKRRASLE